jgi:protein-glutamine gamma-glutamyltransferase
MSREQTWDKDIQLLLVAIIGFNILPHIADIPIWASAISYFFLAWKALALTRGFARPPRWFLWTVSLGCSIGVFFEYQTILGHEAASALLVTLASAKLLETNRYRDAMFVIFTSFFLLMAHLLNSQSLFSTVFMALDVLLITALMFQLHKQERRKSPRAFRPVMKMLALAIPVWIFLFVAFPRFSTGLYRLSTPLQGGGFSENLDPGEIESLTDSQEPAFRINFAGRVPPPEDLYWRGSILTVSDGLRWTKSQRPTWGADSLLEEKTSPKTTADYQVFIEPRFRTWLFALDYPQLISASPRLQQFGVRQRSGQIFETQRPLSGRATYNGLARGEAPLQRMLDEDRRDLLRLPKDLDPRIHDIAKRWIEEAKELEGNPVYPEAADRIADRGLKWFIDQKFRYTKSPGALRAGNGAQQLAQFLFEKKLGFCEHYAAAFATFMRAAGIPSRITVGFQGGIKNEYGDYWLVRDLDAHAWTEIWRAEPGNPSVGRWVRVDPTSVIAPLRIRLGGEYNLLGSDELQANLNASELRAQLAARGNRWLWKAEAAWDAVQMRYNAFLNDFDFEFQKSLLEKIGIPEVTRLFLFLLVGVGIALFLIGLSFALRKRAHKVDPVLEAWRDFCQKLEKNGLEREPQEGPLDFADRATKQLPHKASQIQNVVSIFVALRYGPESEESKAKLRELRQSVRRFSIKASP